MDPVELRCLNAMEEGARDPTGQVIDSAAPVVELLRRPRCRCHHRASESDAPDLRSMPGGVSNTTHGEGVRRGIGYAVAYKNVAFSEGFDDHSTARVRLEVVGDEPVATVHTAAAEVGQGLITVEQQICRTELGVERVVVAPKDTTVGSGGSTSASRQTYVTGGPSSRRAPRCVPVVLARASGRSRSPADRRLELRGAKIVSPTGEVMAELGERPRRRRRSTDRRRTGTARPSRSTRRPDRASRTCSTRSPRTAPSSTWTPSSAWSRWSSSACAQDVGQGDQPGAVLGQIHGGSAQGMGLAIMEEIVVRDGKIMNASFTDYLLPTILDMPPMQVEVLELADPHAPYGLRGVGEAPTISSGPAVVAAIRQATGLALLRVPVRPEHITAAGATP